jgi:hypothetical protein
MRLPLIGRMSAGTGLAIGLGAVVLAPIVIPMVGALVKPVAKGLIKTGMTVYHKTQVMAAETKETWDDLTAEVKAELAQEAVVETVKETKPATGRKKAAS